jgi:hypothetical protein
VEELVKMLELEPGISCNSQDTIQPYNYVSFRILNRIADLLSFENKEKFFGKEIVRVEGKCISKDFLYAHKI